MYGLEPKVYVEGSPAASGEPPCVVQGWSGSLASLPQCVLFRLAPLVLHPPSDWGGGLAGSQGAFVGASPAHGRSSWVIGTAQPHRLTARSLLLDFACRGQ